MGESKQETELRKIQEIEVKHLIQLPTETIAEEFILKDINPQGHGECDKRHKGDARPTAMQKQERAVGPCGRASKSSEISLVI